MSIQRTEAIILKTQPFRTSSLIVTFFSRDFGKLKGIAKGVRDERQTRSSLFELFSRLEIIFYEKTRSELHLISEGFMLESYAPLRERLESIAYASYFAQLIDELCEVHDPHEAIFELFDFTLKFLPSIPGNRLSRLFEIKLMDEIGWLPHLDSCISCNTTQLEEGFFSARQGALLCSKCGPEYQDARALGREPLRVMRYYIRHSLEESIRLGISKKADKELESFMGRFLRDRMNKSLKTQIFLDKIKPVLK